MSSSFDFTHRIAQTVPPTRAPRPGGARPRYDFAVAYPDPDSFPAQSLHEALGRALQEQGRGMVLYPNVQGLPELRELIAQKLERHREMRVDLDQVVLTAGSGQAITLLAEVFAQESLLR